MRNKTKFNPELLKEELNRFKLLENYQFYSEKQEQPVYGDEIDKPIILGDEMELEEDEDVEAAAADVASDLGVDTAQDEAPESQAPVEEPETEVPVEEPEIEEPVEDTSDDVEIDVTSLVQGSEEAKMSADKATQNTEILLQKLSDLESRIASMDAVSSKIENLEKEIVKRNPTPVEKLEMRSLSSFPYSQKLTDYWADKEGSYDVMNKEKDEFTLTQDEIDTTYSEPEIKKSFGVRPEDENDYEEEDI
jgi:hypothetical protein